MTVSPVPWQPRLAVPLQQPALTTSHLLDVTTPPESSHAAAAFYRDCASPGRAQALLY
jgi:hypothetical protein